MAEKEIDAHKIFSEVITEMKEEGLINKEEAERILSGDVKKSEKKDPRNLEYTDSLRPYVSRAKKHITVAYICKQLAGHPDVKELRVFDGERKRQRKLVEILIRQYKIYPNCGRIKIAEVDTFMHKIGLHDLEEVIAQNPDFEHLRANSAIVDVGPKKYIPESVLKAYKF
jgi:hypothetical protein